MDYGFTLASNQTPVYSDIVASVPFDRVLCTEDPGTFADGLWPEGTLYLYVDRMSSRPVECRYDGHHLEVRILVASSPADYRLALSLVEQLSARHDVEIEPPEGPPMDLAQFRRRYGDEWIAEHCRSTLGTVTACCREAGSQITLAGACRDLTIGPRLLASLPDEPERFADEFFERFRRLQYIDRDKVFLAPAITLRNDMGTRTVTVTVLGEGVTTALSEQIDAVILRGRDGASQQVAIDGLAQLLGDAACRLSEDLLLIEAPEGEPWHDILEASAEHRLDDLFAIGSELDIEAGAAEGEPEGATGLAPEDLRALAMGPFLAFLLVAGAAGPSDRQHATRFTEALVAAARHNRGAVGQVLSHALENFAAHLSELKGDPDVIGRIRKLVQVVDRCLPPGPSATYRTALLLLAREVAGSSGAGSNDRWDRLNDREQKAIAALAVLLGVAS